jgi:peptide-methionine (S)-S-oxide reductase
MRRIAINFLLSLSILIAPSVYADKAILAGGCFWCMEKDFESLEGVNDVISGFTGGSAVNPTYGGDHAGHYEAVEITYDPEIVSYQKILDHFWVNIDPFDAEGQFCDKGTSYLSAIFVSNQQERSIAEYSKQRVIEQFPEKNVVTPVLEASTFYPIRGAESYHQDFYKKSPIRYKTYRWSCGRDKRLREIWGTQATH